MKLLTLNNLKLMLSSVVSKFPKPDWKQDNSSHLNYINNKPFYDSRILKSRTLEINAGRSIDDENYYTLVDEYLYQKLIDQDVDDIILDDSIRLKPIQYNTSAYTGNYYQIDKNRKLRLSTKLKNRIYFSNDALSGNSIGTVKLSYDHAVSGNFKRLDDKYLSPDIIRTEEMSNLQTNLQTKIDSCVKKTQYATTSQAGLVRTNTSYGTKMNGQYIQINKATTNDILSKSDQYSPIVPYNLDEAVRYGLGASRITWTDAEKTSARKTIGAISKIDIPKADWKQSDDTQLSYIQNKPFYEYENTPKVLIDEYISLEKNGYYGNYAFSKVLPLIDGERYLVEINDDAFEVECQYSELDLSGKVSSIAQTFRISEDGISTIYYYTSTFNIKITTIVDDPTPIIKQIDEKFIPDNIPKIQSTFIGSLLVVEEVDENNKPIKWKTISIDELASQIQTLLTME